MPCPASSWAAKSRRSALSWLPDTASTGTCRAESWVKNQSSSVQAVVDFFGPSDPCEMMRLAGITFEDLERDEYRIIGDLIGGVEGDARGRMARLAPGGYLEEGALLPPHLIMHGDCDTVVPFSQSLNYYRLLRERGQTAFLVKVCGAEHERRFWSDSVLDEVSAFLRAYL